MFLNDCFKVKCLQFTNNSQIVYKSWSHPTYSVAEEKKEVEHKRAKQFDTFGFFDESIT